MRKNMKHLKFTRRVTFIILFFIECLGLFGTIEAVERKLVFTYNPPTVFFSGGFDNAVIYFYIRRALSIDAFRIAINSPESGTIIIDDSGANILNPYFIEVNLRPRRPIGRGQEFPRFL